VLTADFAPNHDYWIAEKASANGPIITPGFCLAPRGF